MNTSEKRLSKLTLFAYGMGDFASNLCWTFIGSYLSVFYTDVVGMAPAIASAIMLIAKIWDGVNDPMFGAIAERTNTKRGRFRPYILFGAPILAVLSVLAFTTIGRGNAAVIYAAITYIGCGMAYTVVNLSYGSLSTVMTTNPEDIAQLNSWRMMGTNLSSVLLNAITAPLLMKFSGGSESYTAGAYTKVAILFAICALPLFYFVYVNCKETIKPAAGATKVSVGTSIKTVLSNKPLILVFFIQLLAMTAFFGRMGVVIYYLMYNVQRYDLIAALGILSGLTTDELRFAVLSDDVKTISKAPGIGKKTAQKLILELKDKIDLEEAFETKQEHVRETEGKMESKEENAAKKDAVDALTALGYSSTEALRAVRQTGVTPDMDVETILKLALKNMNL